MGRRPFASYLINTVDKYSTAVFIVGRANNCNIALDGNRCPRLGRVQFGDDRRARVRLDSLKGRPTAAEVIDFVCERRFIAGACNDKTFADHLRPKAEVERRVLI